MLDRDKIHISCLVLILWLFNSEELEQGRGIREAVSQEGSDSWVDDIITRQVTSLQFSPKGMMLWPVLEHVRGSFYILVLPLVEPHHLAAYHELCCRSDCGGAATNHSLSSLLLDLPCITGALAVAQVLGDVVSGEVVEPEMLTVAAPSMGGLLDSIAGGMGMGISGIAARAKPVAVPVAAAANAVAAAAATATSAITGSGGKVTLKSADKEALRNFIGGAMPFGTPLDLNPINLAAVRSTGFSSLDVPPTELKQPAWKPYLYRGKQRMVFTVLEEVTAALYDRDDVEDSISLAGQLLCRADMEGLPEISLQLHCPSSSHFDAITFHPCAQAPEQGVDKQTISFSPPLGNFVLARYTTLPTSMQPPLQGFYQLSMISEDEGAFLIRMRLMVGYKAPLVMEQCALSIPFPQRRIVAVEGTPSVGTLSTTEHSMEWKIIVSGRGLASKSTEVTFPGTVKFARKLTPQGNGDAFKDEESDIESNLQNSEYFDVKPGNGGTGLQAAEWEEPLCWEAYSYAKASIKLVGGTMSGISLDPKMVAVYPAVKVPCEFSAQVMQSPLLNNDKVSFVKELTG
jgi:AP-5 complex subunit mu-1